MIFFKQIFKLLSILLYLASLVKLAFKDKKDSPSPEVEEILPALAEVPVIKEEIIISKKKSCLDSLFSFIGLMVAFISIVYLIIHILNRYYIPKYKQTGSLIEAETDDMLLKEGTIRYYSSGEGSPLVLLHSINAGGSSHELESIFNHYSQTRKVIAIDLLGFGISDRPDIKYTSSIYVRHIKEILSYLSKKYNSKIDVIALSLSSEYVATVAAENPDIINKLVLISPTGLGRRISSSYIGLKPVILWLLNQPILGQGIFNLLTSKVALNYYLSNYIFMDSSKLTAQLIDNYYKTTHTTGAKNASAYFISGMLFVKNAFLNYLRLQTPTIIIRGTGAERITRFDDISILLKRNINISERYISNGGSLPYIEKPSEFFDICDNFLDNK